MSELSTDTWVAIATILAATAGSCWKISRSIFHTQLKIDNGFEQNAEEHKEIKKNIGALKDVQVKHGKEIAVVKDRTEHLHDVCKHGN